MRVLTTGRVLAAALATAATAAVLALPASAGTAAPATGHTGVSAATATVRTGSAPGAGATVRTSGVELGPAVKYVRDAGGTVRRVR